MTKFIFPALFSMLISTPLVLMSRPGWDASPPMAQKEMNPLGPWYGAFTDSNFGKNLEDRFNWSFGFRNLMIRVKNQFDYSVLHHSAQVVIGENGWLSDRPTTMEQSWAVDHLTEGQLQQTTDRLLKLNQRLNDIGVKLYLMPIPLKTTLYPEHFPQVAAFRHNNGYLRFRDVLLKLPAVGLIDVYGLLKKQPASTPLFFKTDLHWNEVGALEVSRALIERLAKDQDRPVGWRHPIAYDQLPFTLGTDSVSMGLLKPLTEDRPVLRSTDKKCGSPPNREGTPGIQKPFAARFIADGQCKEPTLPQTLIVGNSFMLYFYWNGLLDHFEEVYTLHDLSQFQNLLANIPEGTKIVVWQFFESELAYQIQSAEWWRQLESPAQFVKVSP